MARRCHCDRLLEFWQTDPRFILVGKATSAVWLELVLMMHRLGDAEGLRFGSQIGSSKELAMVLRLSEAELETHLEPIVARGLLRREPDVGLSLPVELALSAKAKAARNNGLKGGRPRKDGAPPGQRSMVLPLPGGNDAKPMENPTGTREDSRLDRSDDSEESSNQTVRAKQDFALGGEAEALGSKVAALAGVQPGRAVMDHAARWLAKGATPELVLDTVHQVLERVPSGTKIGSLRYFEAPIEHALAARVGRNGSFAQGGQTTAKPGVVAQTVRPAWEVAARALWADDTIAYGARWNMHPSPPAPPDLEAYLAQARAAAGEQTEQAA